MKRPIAHHAAESCHCKEWERYADYLEAERDKFVDKYLGMGEKVKFLKDKILELKEALEE